MNSADRQHLLQYCQARIALPDGPRGCWVWQGNVNAAGTAMCRSARAHGRLAHRVVFELLVAPSDFGQLRAHCATPGCVNPAHWCDGRRQPGPVLDAYAAFQVAFRSLHDDLRDVLTAEPHVFRPKRPIISPLCDGIHV